MDESNGEQISCIVDDRRILLQFWCWLGIQYRGNCIRTHCLNFSDIIYEQAIIQLGI